MIFIKKDKKEALTIYDIAELAGVSKTTISRYINGKFEYMSVKTREKIERIIKEQNFIPNKSAVSLNTRKSKLIAFILSDIENAFAAPTIKAMNALLVKTNYNMIVSSSNNSSEQERILIESALKQDVDGIFINAVDYNVNNFSDLEIDVPVILIDRKINNYYTDFVGSNSIRPMQDAINHLRQQGYTDIHMLTEEYDTVEPRQRRIITLKDSLETFGYSRKEVDEKYIHIFNENTKEEAKNILKVILKNNKNGIPAIICSNGKISLTVAKAIKDLNIRMPFELGFVSFDDFGSNNSLGWTELNSPSITSLSPNWYQLGYRAVELLQQRLQKPAGSKKNINIEVKLDIKESTDLLKQY